MILNRTYKYSIVPNKQQRQTIEAMFTCSNIVYNKYLDDMKKNLDLKTDCYSYLKKYFDDVPFLKMVDRSMLLNTMYKVRYAVNIDSLKERKEGSNIETVIFDYRVDESNVSDYFKDGHILIPCIGNVRIRFHRKFPNKFKIKKITVKKQTDEYYVLFNISFKEEDVMKTLSKNKSIGIDYSPSHFYVDSNGYSIDMPRYLYERRIEIKKEISALSKYDKDSEEYKKHRLKLNKLYNTVENSRNNFLHKLSDSLTTDYDYICFETLDMNEFSRDKLLSMSTKENSFGIFQKMVLYKAQQKGKRVLRVSKWYPSSKVCSICGYKNSSLSLDDRSWTCPKCNTTHDRDINAAINIKNEALKVVNNNAVG